MLEEQVFDTARHDRFCFECGEPALDEFLQKYAAQQSAKGINTVFVMVDTTQSSHILGYYTLSAAQVEVEQLSAAARKKLPRYPVPCFRMGRLACNCSSQGKGIGKILVGLAVDRCLKAKEHLCAYALLVDTKNDKAKFFYQSFGFTAFADSPRTLYLAL